MGLASGKLTISHTEDKNKTETVAEVDSAASHPVNAAQPITSKNHVAVEPAANGDQAAVVTGTEAPAAVTENGPNGTVNTADAHGTDVGNKEDKPAKKTKNPLVWIQRRLSKRHSTSKKPATTDKATEEDVAGAEVEEQQQPNDDAGSVPKVVAVAPVVDRQIVEAASSLVDQVLNTALVQQLSDTNVESSAMPEVVPPTTPEPVESHEPSTPIAHTEEQAEQVATTTPSVDHQCTTEQTAECVPVEHSQMEEASSAVQEVAHGDAVQMTETESNQPEPELPQPEPEAEAEEEKTTEPAETEPVVDSNNTNAECAEHEQQHEEQHNHQEVTTEEQTALETAAESENQTEYAQEPMMHSDDPVVAKLSSLELTNGHGHAENHVTNGEASAEVVLNGN